MNRRELIAAAASAAALIASASAAHAGEHEHHHSGGGAGPNAKIAAAAAGCGTAGQACLSHTLTLIASGDTSLAACAKSVYQMMAVCTGLARVAAADSPHVTLMAKAAYAICADCEKECRKHEQHAECKACADACSTCAEECKKLAA
jgi:Cys-rich four helix bundle protein (predicted Tat secretion target)